MEREMKDVGMTWVAQSKKAQDRDVWRMFVCGLYTLTGVRGNDDDILHQSECLNIIGLMTYVKQQISEPQ